MELISVPPMQQKQRRRMDGVRGFFVTDRKGLRCSTCCVEGCDAVFCGDCGGN